MLHKTRFNVVNTNSVNYAAFQPIMQQSESFMLPYTTHYATIKVNHAASQPIILQSDKIIQRCI